MDRAESGGVLATDRSAAGLQTDKSRDSVKSLDSVGELNAEEECLVGVLSSRAWRFAEGEVSGEKRKVEKGHDDMHEDKFLVSGH